MALGKNYPCEGPGGTDRFTQHGPKLGRIVWVHAGDRPGIVSLQPLGREMVVCSEAAILILRCVMAGPKEVVEERVAVGIFCNATLCGLIGVDGDAEEPSPLLIVVLCPVLPDGDAFFAVAGTRPAAKAINVVIAFIPHHGHTCVCAVCLSALLHLCRCCCSAIF